MKGMIFVTEKCKIETIDRIMEKIAYLIKICNLEKTISNPTPVPFSKSNNQDIFQLQ